MKQFYVLCCLFLCLAGNGQNNQGVVIYEESYVWKGGELEYDSEYEDEVDDWKVAYILLFDGTESIFKLVDHDTINTDDFEPSEFENRYYVNTEKKQAVEKMSLLGRNFLIDDSKEINWKITGKQSIIEGYRCLQATSRIDTVNVTAWFAPEIPMSFGPKSSRGLPGLILSANYGEEQYFKAVKVDLRALTDKEKETIVLPNKGKKMTREEFNDLILKMMKKMEAMEGGWDDGY